MKNFFRGRFSGEFFCKIFRVFPGHPANDPAPAAGPNPRHNAPGIPSGTIRAPGHMNGNTRHPAPAAGQPNRQRRNSSARPQQAQPIRAGKSRVFSQAAADPAGKAGAASYTHTRAHKPAGQRNACPGTQAAHSNTGTRHTRTHASRQARQARPIPYTHSTHHSTHSTTQPTTNQQPNARDSTKRARTRIMPAHPRGGSKRARA